MADTTVIISSDGTPTPNTLEVYKGDVVSWVADGADVVLCISKPQYFGGPRFEIPNGETLDLEVRNDNMGGFEFLIKTGDLSAKCKGGRGEPGGGEAEGEGGP